MEWREKKWTENECRINAQLSIFEDAEQQREKGTQEINVYISLSTNETYFIRVAELMYCELALLWMTESIDEPFKSRMFKSYSVSVIIFFDFQCQCIQWLLFVRSVNRHCARVLYLSLPIQLSAFASRISFLDFVFQFHFNDNDMKSYNKYCYLLATFFSPYATHTCTKIRDCFAFDIYIELPESFAFDLALLIVSISWPLIQFAFLRRQFSIY